MSRPGDDRTNPEDAYKAFMGMSSVQWALLLRDLFNGGVLTPAEQEGFDRAMTDRSRDTPV